MYIYIGLQIIANYICIMIIIIMFQAYYNGIKQKQFLWCMISCYH
jgi:hypothetical protein